jgi:hypothetical protein
LSLFRLPRDATDGKGQEQQELLGKLGRDLGLPAMFDEEGENLNGGFDDAYWELVLLAEEMRQWEEDVAGQLFIEDGGIAARLSSPGSRQGMDETADFFCIRGKVFGAEGNLAQRDADGLELLSRWGLASSGGYGVKVSPVMPTSI